MPTFACSRCGTNHEANEYLNNRTGEHRSRCRKCEKAVQTAASKARPAYKAMAREQQRDLMRRKRQTNDDVMRASHYFGLSIIAPFHAFIPTPVEALEAKEDWEEHCIACGNKTPQTYFHPVENREIRCAHQLTPHSF
jgi:DNA-directed RNA polymerase subunit M/transcription elongation factor TFIIS